MSTVARGVRHTIRSLRRVPVPVLLWITTSVRWLDRFSTRWYNFTLKTLGYLVAMVRTRVDDSSVFCFIRLKGDDREPG